MKRKDIQIFILSHKKEDFVLDNNLFTPVETGSYYNEIPSYELRDNDKIDNISYLNPCFLENTGLYYVYKYLSDDYDYIGINQHRRQFNLQENMDFSNIFIKYKIICHKENLRINVKKHYDTCHNIDDLNTVCDIIINDYPEYKNAVNKLNNITYLYTNCCFITDKETFKDYCNFFFDIIWKYLKKKNLYSLNKIMDYGIRIAYKKEKAYDKLLKNYIYQSRIAGYLQERIFTIYVLTHFKDDEILSLNYRQIKNGNYKFQTNYNIK